MKKGSPKHDHLEMLIIITSKYYFFRYGRVRTMVPFSILTITIAFLSAFSPSYWVFTLSRFVIGFTISVIVPLMFVISSEIVTSKYRPAAGINLWIWFYFGFGDIGRGCNVCEDVENALNVFNSTLFCDISCLVVSIAFIFPLI